MIIDNTTVYNLENSIVASGLPMWSEYSNNVFLKKVKQVSEDLKTHNDNADITRFKRLASNGSNTGHPNALTGVLVTFNVTSNQTWLRQAERYHFFQIVSSMSLMHRASKMTFTGEEYTYCNKMRDVYNENPSVDNFNNFVNSIPLGVQLTMHVATNYLQLKNIYSQRCNHKLKEWNYFTKFIEGLPLSEVITNAKSSN